MLLSNAHLAANLLSFLDLQRQYVEGPLRAVRIVGRASAEEESVRRRKGPPAIRKAPHEQAVADPAEVSIEHLLGRQPNDEAVVVNHYEHGGALRGCARVAVPEVNNVSSIRDCACLRLHTICPSMLPRLRSDN